MYIYIHMCILYFHEYMCSLHSKYVCDIESNTMILTFKLACSIICPHPNIVLTEDHAPFSPRAGTSESDPPLLVPSAPKSLRGTP